MESLFGTFSERRNREANMTAQTKIALRRFALRWLRKLVDLADDRLHAAEVRFREQPKISCRKQVPRTVAQTVQGKRRSSEDMPHQLARRQETFQQWEARRSGIAPIIKRSSRRGMTASEFDRRYV